MVHHAIFKCSLTLSALALVVASAAVVGDQKKLIVIDADPGVDDATAILTVLGDPNSTVLAITCVRGNVLVKQAVTNVFKILTLASKLEIPVYSGHDVGLVEMKASDNAHGSDGFFSVEVPSVPASVKVQEEHAAAYLARVAKENPGKIDFLALGPLTNFALALHLNADFLRQARRVVVMGGSINGRGNVMPSVEFNFYADPEAAHVVLEQALMSETVVTLLPLETVRDFALSSEWRWDTLGKVNNSVVNTLNKMDAEFQKQHQNTDYRPYDTYAALDLLSDQFVTASRHVYGFVEHESQKLSGFLSLDYSNVTKNPPNLDVVVEVNTEVLKSKLLENLSKFT